MSIINEALKKTEQFIQQNESKKNSSLNKKIKPKSFLLYILILLIVIVLSNFTFSQFNHKTKLISESKSTALIQPQQSVELPVTPKEPVLPKEEKAPEEIFVLNGIFFSNNDSYALINNQIVRENETINGAKVLQITENTVKLDNQGKSITLSSSR